MTYPLPPTLCFLDLDNVLADFAWAAYERFVPGQHPPYADQIWEMWRACGVDESGFWRDMDEEFWHNLPRTHEFDAIVDHVTKLFGVTNVFIVSSPCRTHGCITGKASWVEYHLPQFSRRVIFTNRKEILAGPGRLLIDDHDSNIEKWEAMGGCGLLVPRPWNKSKETRRDVTDIILPALNFLFEIRPPSPSPSSPYQTQLEQRHGKIDWSSPATETPAELLASDDPSPIPQEG